MRTYTVSATVRNRNPQQQMYTESLLASCNSLRFVETMASPQGSEHAAIVMTVHAPDFNEYMLHEYLHPFEVLYEQLSVGLWGGHVVTFSMPHEFYLHVAYHLLKMRNEGLTLGSACRIVREEWAGQVTLPQRSIETPDTLYRYTDFPHIDTEQAGRDVRKDVLLLWRICLAVALLSQHARGSMEAALYLARYFSEELGIQPPLIWPSLGNFEQKHADTYLYAWTSRTQAAA